MLLVFGVVMLVPVVTAIATGNFQDRDLPLRIFGMLLVPGALIFTGLALKRGKTVAERGPIDAEK